MQIGDVRLFCALGRGGISAFKREGDGATPLASLAVVSGFCKEHIPTFGHSFLPLKRNGKQDGWCDAKGDANYNRPVRLPYPTRAFFEKVDAGFSQKNATKQRTRAEVMRRDDALYDIGFVLDWNIRSRIQGRGSAIFLHLVKAGQDGHRLSPTQGCIALDRRDMKRILPYLTHHTKIIINR